MPKETTILGNYYDKYGTKNPIERYLINNYEKTLVKIIKSLNVKSIYEVGSGEGVILKWVSEIDKDIKLFGSDIYPTLDLSFFIDALVQPSFIINEAEHLPLSNKPVDLIIACEVLEHLVDPSRCLQEFQRLNADYYLLTVPNDNLWKTLNIFRLKYIKNLGNTPGHLNHWTKKTFCKFVSDYLNIQYSLYVQPWIFVLASGRKAI